ncbi:hypothetical protein [Cupriavidus pinatubonensis]|uniref:hypothetical protein n=1 Tax=Cupriavidus pinatubonensis TaxID=248026 RepID=UPI00112C6699|nr:hypothetical protein [Cupriavidus pinatubonensis]
MGAKVEKWRQTRSLSCRNACAPGISKRKFQHDRRGYLLRSCTIARRGVFACGVGILRAYTAASTGLARDATIVAVRILSGRPRAARAHPVCGDEEVAIPPHLRHRIQQILENAAGKPGVPAFGADRTDSLYLLAHATPGSVDRALEIAPATGYGPA